MSTTNASSSALISFAQDVDYTKMEGFKQYKAIFNQKNTCATCNNPRGTYLTAEDVYNTVKSSGCLQRTFDALLLQDFITLGSIATRCHLKCLSLAPYYAVQMNTAWKSGTSVITKGWGQKLSTPVIN